MPEMLREDTGGVEVTPRLSVIVAVYNKPEVLRLLFAALGRQSFVDFEAIIADDGSGPAVREVVKEAQQQFPFPIIHLWHEDLGWRKNAMLNNGIRAASTDQLVFIDGDCLPSRLFLHDHWHQWEEKKLLIGRRVETSERWSRALTLEKVQSGEFERLGWEEMKDGVRGASLRVEDGIRMPSRLVRKVLLRKVQGLLGSNFSIAKKELVAINGFDEMYNGPGCGEDSDLQYRLSLNGVTGKSLRNLAVQYHVYHPRTKVSDLSWQRFEMVKKKGEMWCERGLEKKDWGTSGLGDSGR